MAYKRVVVRRKKALSLFPNLPQVKPIGLSGAQHSAPNTVCQRNYAISRCFSQLVYILVQQVLSDQRLKQQL